MQWYITNRALWEYRLTYVRQVFSHSSANSGLSRFSFCRQADALPEHRSLNTEFITESQNVRGWKGPLWVM